MFGIQHDDSKLFDRRRAVLGNEVRGQLSRGGEPWTVGHAAHQSAAAKLDRGQNLGRAGPADSWHVLQMIQVMSELTGKNFLVDDKVRGTVTLIAPTPVTLEEAYQIFLAALAMQGFTVVPQGPIIKIIPSRDAKVHPLPTTIDTSRPHQ